jgi:hypothetical protein
MSIDDAAKVVEEIHTIGWIQDGIVDTPNQPGDGVLSHNWIGGSTRRLRPCFRSSC